MLAEGSKQIFFIFGLISFLSSVMNIFSRKTIFLYTGVVFFLFFVFSLYFFRDPERNGKISMQHMLSPADGRVVSIDGHKICIFMSLTDVHVNRIPMDGQVLETWHSKGSFIPAFLKKSEYNERMTTKLETPYGSVELVQIAGFGFRRIRSYIRAKDVVSQNQRFGVILFGSRVDVTVPDSFDIHVRKYQKVKAGVSVIASLKDSETNEE